MKRRNALWAVTAFAVACTGCQTTKDPDSGAEAAPPPAVEFAPARYKVDVQFAEGRYNDLFAPDSYALWVSSAVGEAKFQQAVEDGAAPDERYGRDAVFLTDNYILIETHVVSAFGDMSIAYDTVGLRNVTVYLETPGGNKLAPLQKIFTGTLQETQDGALKRYARDIVLVFPKRDLWLHAPTLEPGAPSIKLVFESAQGTFQFEWPAGPPDAAPPALTAEERIAALKVSFGDFYGRMRSLARNFH